MATNYFKVAFVIFIYITTVCATCKKRINCRETIFSFTTNIEAFPDNDSLSINDTIWLEFEAPTNLVDNVTGNTINYSGAINLGTDISFDQFVGGSVNNPGTIPAVNAFDYRLITGIFIPDNVVPDRNKDYKFEEIAGIYRFKLGIVPKRAGVYSLAIGNAVNVYRSNQECDKAAFQITFANTNQHLYFYEQNRPGYTPSEYERTHMYCFKVK